MSHDHSPDRSPDQRQRFIDIYQALDADRGWFGDAGALRFAAFAALPCPGTAKEVAAAVRSTAEEIKERSGWFGQLNSPLRFIISTLLACHGVAASTFLAELERTQKLFRELKLRRGGIYETIAILVLLLQTGRPTDRKRPAISKRTVERFQAIYEEMKRHHWWLTGPDDFPACAVLTGSKEGAHDIGRKVENIFQALHANGFSKGDPLQTAANLLYLAGEDAHTVAKRFRALATGFKDAGISMWQSDYDELAILSFLDVSPTRLIDRVLDHREAMNALKPRPDRSTTFTLAAGIAFIELVPESSRVVRVTDVKTLLDLQAVVNAQQAAAAAAASSAAHG